ncbi:MAG TPA: type IV pilus secretin PilQ [Terriglobales bacterium]|nr:type IV pilus secretin PilQ [Terriglobales bacterium]
MRKQLLGVLLPLFIAGLVMAADTQTTSTTRTAESGQPHALLKRLNVVHGADGISVEMTGLGQLQPKLSMMDRPDRLVIDLPNTVAVTDQRRLAVDSDGVKAVRVGMDGQVPPTTRVVVDLAMPLKYEMVPDAGKIVLKLHPSATSAKSQQLAPDPAKAATPQVVSAQAQPAKLQESKSAATVAASSTPKEFVFVEPSYQAKPKADLANITPPARSIEAAAKFADKPASDLLPKPSGALQSSAPAAGQAAPAQATSAPASGTQAPAVPASPAVNMSAEQKAQMAQQQSLNGPKYTGEPISVNLKDVDLKDFFRLVHEISGLNVVLDPNVHGTLTIVLDDVPWDQALDIVLKNNGLSRQLEGNVLRIATVETLKREADAKRAQIESEQLAVDRITVTRFLSYAHSKDLVNTVKQFLSQRGSVISDDRTNALIIEDIPTSVPPIDRLLAQLDRKTQEVEIEARVVASTRSFARDLGTQFGFGFGNRANALGGASSVGTSPVGVFGLNPLYTIVGTAAPSGTTLSQIPLFSNLPAQGPTSGLTFLNYSTHVQIDAILTAAESRGLLKILSRPRVVTQNNIQALVKQGVRVPIVTQAQLGGPPTVTYVDAFLRLTVTPQITSENTIFLNVDVENTTPDFGRQVQGNPTLITQQATTQVLVTDGGTVVIGGVIQTQNNISVQQVPLLGNIPVLGNLFKRQAVSTNNQELIFFITPRIIQT